MALAIDVDGRRPKERQEEDPEHDRTIQAAPVGNDLVEEWLDAVGIARDVFDRIVVGQERIDQTAEATVISAATR